MKEIKKEEIQQEVFDLYDDYAHSRIDRKQFIGRLTTFAIGGLTLSSLLGFIMPNYSKIQVKADDSRLDSEYINYESPKGGGTIKALISKRNNLAKKFPGVIVVHENRGLNPHIEDVSRRAALEGFISIAPDALSPLGGYPGSDDEGRVLQKKRDKNEMLEDFIAAYAFLKDHPDCNGKIGVVGFCFGGWISNMMAVKVTDLLAAVPYYGGQPSADVVAQIKTPLLLHFAELDTRVNKGWPAYEARLSELNKDYTAYIYPKVNHGFHNDTTPRYDKEAAELSWRRTISFFKEHLK
ncbi:dienelactone hydrolase family protein [Labilibacter marinus]|uniref:dienelactone hydrolase family protein n=1 Tax=Labilibacter marinus TaxID=1477105 RepID=UPI0008369085|nr:dienelactone hydrolase family protein [Labilibacter marinus]